MAQQIRLGLLIDDPEDVREFEENMKNPDFSEERIDFFKEAIRVYNTHKF